MKTMFLLLVYESPAVITLVTRLRHKRHRETRRFFVEDCQNETVWDILSIVLSIEFFYCMRELLKTSVAGCLVMSHDGVFNLSDKYLFSGEYSSFYAG